MASRDYLADFAVFRAAHPNGFTQYQVYRELRERIDGLLETLDKIAAPLECGCRPCTGQCVNTESLREELDGRRELASEAAARIRGAA